MDLATLKAISGNRSGVPYEKYLPHLNQALLDANCTTFLRVAHFMAQVLHESGSFVYLREIHDGSNYEGRRDLGNTQPGDGRRFRGRGIIQLTGRHWATEFSKWAHSKGMVNSPTYFVDHPEKMEQPEWAFRTASFYWTVARPGLNGLCDRDDFVAVTKAVNGGTNGLADRRAYLARAKAQGSKILPTANKTGGYVSTRKLNYYTVEPDATLLTKSFTPGRNGKTINCIYRHHMAGNLNLQQCVNLWNTSGTSAHYTINATGGVGQAVWDSNTAWATGHTDGNQRGISIEHANITRQINGSDYDKGSWNISDATIIGGARLAAALCLFYKLGRPVYGKNIKDHRDVRQTFCPGHLANGGMYHKKWMDEAQSFYDKLVAKSVHPDGTPKNGKDVDDLSAAAEKKINEIHFQLLNEWGQLGNKTPVDAIALLLDQTVGWEKDPKTGKFKFNGWPGIEGNNGKTIVEAVAELQKSVDKLQADIDAIKGR